MYSNVLDASWILKSKGIHQLVDYFIVDISYLNAEELLNKFTGRVDSSFDFTTGEFKFISSNTGRYEKNPFYEIDLNGITIQIFNSDPKKQGLILLRGSVPKFLNNGFHNFSKVGTEEIVEFISILKKRIDFDSCKSHFKRMEYGKMGVNPSHRFIKNATFHLGRNNMGMFEGHRFKKIFRSDEIIKIYSPNQKLKSDYHINKPVYKFEISCRNKRQCERLGVSNFDSLLSTKVQGKLKKKLETYWNDTFIHCQIAENYHLQSEDYWNSRLAFHKQNNRRNWRKCLLTEMYKYDLRNSNSHVT